MGFRAFRSSKFTDDILSQNVTHTNQLTPSAPRRRQAFTLTQHTTNTSVSAKQPTRNQTLARHPKYQSTLLAHNPKLTPTQSPSDSPFYTSILRTFVREAYNENSPAE